MLNTQVYDEIMPIDNEVCFTTAKLEESKGQVRLSMQQLSRQNVPENKGKTIVALLPDTGDRYYSTALFTE